MTRVRLSSDAAAYLRAEAEYLRQRNPAAARNFLSIVKKARQTLQDFPDAGNRMHGLQVAGSLTLVAGDYLIHYLHDGSTVDIILIRHGRTQLPMPAADLDSDL